MVRACASSHGQADGGSAEKLDHANDEQEPYDHCDPVPVASEPALAPGRRTRSRLAEPQRRDRLWRAWGAAAAEPVGFHPYWPMRAGHACCSVAGLEQSGWANRSDLRVDRSDGGSNERERERGSAGIDYDARHRVHEAGRAEVLCWPAGGGHGPAAPHPRWMTSDRGATSARRRPRLRGSQDSHNRPFSQREALTP
jgi:hypothetical protein